MPLVSNYNKVVMFCGQSSSGKSTLASYGLKIGAEIYSAGYLHSRPKKLCTALIVISLNFLSASMTCHATISINDNFAAG